MDSFWNPVKTMFLPAEKEYASFSFASGVVPSLLLDVAYLRFTWAHCAIFDELELFLFLWNPYSVQELLWSIHHIGDTAGPRRRYWALVFVAWHGGTLDVTNQNAGCCVFLVVREVRKYKLAQTEKMQICVVLHQMQIKPAAELTGNSISHKDVLQP